MTKHTLSLSTNFVCLQAVELRRTHIAMTLRVRVPPYGCSKTSGKQY